MENLNFGYLWKNIPTLRLLEKIEIFIKQMRWRANFL